MISLEAVRGGGRYGDVNEAVSERKGIGHVQRGPCQDKRSGRTCRGFLFCLNLAEQQRAPGEAW